MTDSVHDASNESPDDRHSSTTDPLAELRNLLIGPEHTEIVKLQERLNDPKLYAADLSRVLPEAIILRSLEQDKQLTEALLPSVEEAIKASVKKDLNILADAIFPVIGPAIRKSITVAISTLTQSLNQTLEHSLSPQSFKWRLEAQQTGKSFAEVVLLRTLLYRVEQVFLIHKKTGLVLQHVVVETVAAQDADLVSAMLTAIQDFVRDSFSVPQGDSLETLHFGELTIWIEQGPQAILAGVIRGNAPQELRLVFQKALERIHREFQNTLDSFEGDNAPFEASRHYLEDCLQTRYEVKNKKTSPFLWILLGVLLFGLGLWTFVSLREKQRWTAYVTKLNAEPGIVVTTAERRHGKYYISGLRDPLATNPITMIQEARLNPEEVISHWEPYLSFDSKFIAVRAKQLLQPPKTVSLKVDENGILYATGSAPRQWTAEAQKRVRVIPGITQFQEENLIESDITELELSKQQIEKQVLRFVEGSTQLKPGQDATLQTLVREIKKLSNSAPLYNKDVHIQIVGHTDDKGSEQKNLILSQARAYAILSTLVSKGLKSTNLTAVGVGTREPLLNEFTEHDKQLNRSITFKVFLTDAPNQTFTNQ